LIADLSNQIIDERFSKADISGSNLTGATIKGEIDQLIMRDCITLNTLFEECRLTNPDLRGTDVVDNIFHDTVITNGKFKANIKSQDLQSSLLEVRGENTLYDPCYNNRTAATKRTSIKCTKEDITRYIVNKSVDQSFTSYLKQNPLERSPEEIAEISNLDDNEIVADFSGQDLKGVTFNGVFKNCDFSGAEINECKFNDSIMENCNFSEVKQPAQYWSEYAPKVIRGYLIDVKPIKMDRATFKNCDFTSGDLSNASGSGVTFDNVTATNLIAHNLTLAPLKNSDGTVKPSKITQSNFKRADLSDSKGEGLVIENSNFSLAYLTRFHDSEGPSKVKITRSCFTGTSFEGANLDGSSANLDDSYFTYSKTSKETNFKSTRLKGTNFSQSQLHGDTGRNWMSFLTHNKTNGDKNTKFNNTDFGLNLHGESIGDINTSNALESKNAHEAMKLEAEEKIKRNKQKVYNRAGMVIIAVLVIASVAFPPLLAATVPLAIAAIATPVITTVIPTLIMAMTAELAARNASSKSASVGYWTNKANGLWNKITGRKPAENDDYQGPSLIRPIANLFGAKQIVNGLNLKPERDKKSHKEAMDSIGDDVEITKSQEPLIENHSKKKDIFLNEEERIRKANPQTKSISKGWSLLKRKVHKKEVPDKEAEMTPLNRHNRTVSTH
jgi:uncharacterized protein YjbI with pentapeptide repeats